MLKLVLFSDHGVNSPRKSRWIHLPSQKPPCIAGIQSRIYKMYVSTSRDTQNPGSTLRAPPICPKIKKWNIPEYSKNLEYPIFSIFCMSPIFFEYSKMSNIPNFQIFACLNLKKEHNIPEFRCTGMSQNKFGIFHDKWNIP